MTATQTATRTELFIGGEERAPGGSDYYQLYNPARPDELVGEAASGTPEDIDAACKAAQAAFPAWAALSYAERADYLRKIADHLVADKKDLEFRINLFTREHGKILKESTIEMTRLGDRFLLCAEMAERLAKDDELNGPPFDTIITRQPRGVAALIVPWNWPLSILGAKLPQALVSGNTCVVKPSQNSAMAPSMTLRKIAEILPPGVLNIVTGSASNIGDPLLSHPLVRKINFTGSIAVGKHVMRLAADNLTPVTLELGGNDAGIFLEDAILDDAAFMRMYLAAFMTSGQICMALKRVYVHRSRYDELCEGLIAAASCQVVGDPLLPATTMGPVNNKSQHAVVSGMLDQAREKGADVREFGEVPDEALYRGGYFQKPALIFDPDPALDIVKDEQFGPALPIMPFDSEEEAVQLANDSDYGLCSSVWSADRDRAVSIARQLEAGYTYLNGHGPLAQDNRGPFGGFKQSGVGRNLGYEGILEFQEYHSISGPAGWLL
ncbi:MAG: aldehyde dehydrogenase family protein [Proteobacteria bacterium]|nr:aldehyde dehydrogenase family protein [Pseudomonadota bacterium]